MDKLSKKLDNLYDETGIGPEQTHVTVDASNVYFWKDGANRSTQLPKLVDLLADLNVGGVSYYTPEVLVDPNKIYQVRDWMIRVCGLGASELEGYADSELIGVLADFSRDKTLIPGRLRKTMPADVKMMMLELQRADKFRRQSQLFRERGFEVVSREETVHNRVISDDKVLGAVLNRTKSRLPAPDAQPVREIRDLSSDVRHNLRAAIEEMGAISQDSVIMAKYSEVLRKFQSIDKSVSVMVSKLGGIDAALIAANELTDAVMTRRERTVKCDLDPLIIADGLDPVKRGKYKVEVTLSGDGDFDHYYEALRNSGKRSVVVSTQSSLNAKLNKVAGLVLHLADGEDIFYDEDGGGSLDSVA